MPSSYTFGDVTLPAGSSVRLSSLMVTEGYTGNFIGAFLRISSQALTDVFQGSTSAVSATVGTPIAVGTHSDRAAAAPRWCVDPSRIWLFSTAGGSVGVVFETF